MEKEKQRYIYFRDDRGHMVTTRKPRMGQNKTIRAPLIEEAKYIFKNGHLELLEAPPQAELQIRPGATYKTRDGRKAQIWAVNKDSVDKPVLGMINTDGTWEARYWNLKGNVKLPYGVGNDIISEWSEA